MNDLDTLLTALHVKIDDEIGETRWLGRPPKLADSGLWALANPKIDEREVLTAVLDREPEAVTDRPGLLVIADKGFASMENSSSRPNAGDLSSVLPSDGDGVRCGWCPVGVLGPFERPVGHLAFDHSGAGAVAAWGQEAFGDLSQGAGQCPGESAGGKTPPGPGPGGARSAGTG